MDNAWEQRKLEATLRELFTAGTVRPVSEVKRGEGCVGWWFGKITLY